MRQSTAPALSCYSRRTLHRLDLLFNVREQVRHGHLQPLRDRHQGLDRQVMFATLDATHVRSMQPAVIGEPFLGKAVLRP